MEWYIYVPCIVAVAVALIISYVNFNRKGRGA
jgi:hypothetical protein